MKPSNLFALRGVDARNVTRTFGLTLILAGTLVAAPSLALGATLYSVGGDLETNLLNPTPTNPNGAWQYGQASTAAGGSFLATTTLINTGAIQGWWDPTGPGPLTFVNTSNAVVDDPGPIAPGAAVLHPGPNVTNGYAEFLFTAPATGLYSINGAYTSANSGTDDVHVVVNGVSQYDHFFAGTYPTSDSFTGQFHLTAGSTIAFTEGAYNSGMTQWSYNSNLMGLTATITQTPEPSSIALFGLAAVCLFAVARRGKA